MGTQSVAVSVIRGGTSKGVFLRLGDLPEDARSRDELALGLLGSPDPMQLDGLGGTYSSTSKLMAVGTPDEARAHGYHVPEGIAVTYLFAAVGIAQPVVDWRSNCGNLTAGVAIYAIHEGMVGATDPVTALALLNLNTGVHVDCRVPTEDGQPRAAGDFSLAGVPGSGARIDLAFLDPANGLTGRLLPTAHPVEEITVDRQPVPTTILDVTSPVAIAPASSFGLAGHELPAALNADRDLLGRLERLRVQAAVRCGLASSATTAAAESPGVPRVILVAPPIGHQLESGEVVAAGAADCVARVTSMGKVHHAFTGTGLMAAAVAALLPGTVLDGLARPTGVDVRLAHPKGVVTVSADIQMGPDGPVVRSVSVPRTARRLLTGVAYLRPPR